MSPLGRRTALKTVMLKLAEPLKPALTGCTRSVQAPQVGVQAHAPLRGHWGWTDDKRFSNDFATAVRSWPLRQREHLEGRPGPSAMAPSTRLRALRACGDLDANQYRWRLSLDSASSSPSCRPCCRATVGARTGSMPYAGCLNTGSTKEMTRHGLVLPTESSPFPQQSAERFQLGRLRVPQGRPGQNQLERPRLDSSTNPRAVAPVQVVVIAIIEVDHSLSSRRAVSLVFSSCLAMASLSQPRAPS